MVGIYYFFFLSTLNNAAVHILVHIFLSCVLDSFFRKLYNVASYSKCFFTNLLETETLPQLLAAVRA